MDELTKNRIREHLITVMNRLIYKRTIAEPFSREDIQRNNPFGYYLVPIEVWKGAKFERSFVTSLGQGILEQLGKIIAEGTGAYATNQHDTVMTINTWRLEKIDELLKTQRGKGKKGEGTVKPSWAQEVRDVLNLYNQRFEDVVIRSDLYIRREDGREEFYSFKTVKPNLDQTEAAKRDMLLLKAGNPECSAYFGLPFNPAGEGNSYRQAHAVPYKLFNMDADESVLIGSALWNQIGENECTYDELIEIFQEVGAVYSNRIRSEYLGI